LLLDTRFREKPGLSFRQSLHPEGYFERAFFLRQFTQYAFILWERRSLSSFENRAGFLAGVAFALA